MDHRKLRFRKGDMAAIAAVLVLAVLVLLPFVYGKDAPGAYAEVYRDGELICKVSLAEDQEFMVTGKYSNTIAVQDGKIAIIQSDCPGEDCVHSGWLGSSARSLVCLPNGVEIRVVAESDDVDFVVG